ncbi:hypothetical protein [Roseomonas sp. HF4]|uniref:hypothetical protein n=1 Tax=Roseomonas sp. HF4 TaxID=2562313 RepID=UPI0010C01566|nr:hypothetical protein [Roseomonas sp. HF4]
MARRAAPILGLVMVLGACAPDTYFPPSDFERAGTWQGAEGVNDRNLRAMVADPAHLTAGVGAASDRGSQGTAAVTALEAGRRPALPRGLSDIGGQTTGASGVTSGGGGASRN